VRRRNVTKLLFSDVHMGVRPMIRSEKKRKKSIEAIYPTVIIDYVSVKLPESVSNFLFSGFSIVGQTPVCELR
jgi:hypothetical protein